MYFGKGNEKKTTLPHTHRVLPNKPAAQIGKLAVLFVWRHTPTATSTPAGLHLIKMRWGMAWWWLCAVCCLPVEVGMDPSAEGDAAIAAGPAGAAAVWLDRKLCPRGPGIGRNLVVARHRHLFGCGRASLGRRVALSLLLCDDVCERERLDAGLSSATK